MKIKGANLEETEAIFDNLSNIKWSDDETIQNLIKYLEQLYYSLCNNKDVITVEQFPMNDDGKVIIKPGMLNHRCANDFEILRHISKHGVLASEWFGILESEREGRFCTFISRMKGKDYPYKGDLAEDDYSRLNIGNNIILFFDENNLLMQYLLHLDYFEYEKIKQNEPDKLQILYSEKERELFDKLIEPMSPSGKDMRNDYQNKTNYWSAIPGGIPSFLINGICVKNNQFTIEQINELSYLFPNATIFKNDLDIICLPCNALQNDERKTL